MTTALGWVGSGLVVMSLTQGDIRRLRQVNLAASAVLGVFNIVLGIASMIALNAVLAGVNGYHLVRNRSAERGVDQLRPAPPRTGLPTSSTGRAQIDAERRFAAAGIPTLHGPSRL